MLKMGPPFVESYAQENLVCSEIDPIAPQSIPMCSACADKHTGTMHTFASGMNVYRR